MCVTDGYQVCHTVEKEREELKIAGCWSHARCRYDETVKALLKSKQKDSRAYLVLTMIQAIYREEKLGHDRYSCRSQIQCDCLQYCRDCESEQSEIV